MEFYQGTDRTDKAVFGEMDIEAHRESSDSLDRWSMVRGRARTEPTRSNADHRVDQQLPNRTADDDGFIPKYGLELQITEDVMFYGIYSEGYRVGGTNRGRGLDKGGPTLPVAYESDIIENTEFGLKTSFADGRVIFNAVYYDMQWQDMQIEVTDPSFNLGIPFQSSVGNVGDATVKGYDMELKALIGENLEFGFNMTEISDAYVEAPAFYDETRAPGGQIASGLEPQSDLPLFADQLLLLLRVLRHQHGRRGRRVAIPAQLCG